MNTKQILILVLRSVHFYLAIFTLVILIAGSYFFYNLTADSEVIGITFGIALGVGFGFLSFLLKSGIEKILSTYEKNKILFSLLTEDAKSLVRLMHLYRTGTAEGAPEQIRDSLLNGIPPKPKLIYWSIVSSNKDYLELASSDRVRSIFEVFWSFNQLVDIYEEYETKTATGEKTFVNKLYAFIYKDHAEKYEDLKLLSLLIGEDKAEQFHEDLKKGVQ